MRLAGFVAHVGGEKRKESRLLVGEGEERDHSEYQGIDGRIILKCLKEMRCNDMDYICLSTGTYDKLLWTW